jgi:inner membrane protein
VKRMALEPYPINPFRWHAILETASFTRLPRSIRGPGDRQRSADGRDLQAAGDAATEAAKRTPLGQVYLDWGTWAVVRDVGQIPVAGMDPPKLPPNRNGRRSSSRICGLGIRIWARAGQRPEHR